MKIINNIKYHVSMIKRGLSIMIKMEKRYIILGIIHSVVGTLIRYITIVMSALIIDELVGARDVKKLILYVILTVGVNMIFSLTSRGLSHTIRYHQSQFYKNEKMFFAEKIMSMDYDNIEDREVHLLYEKIKIENQTGFNAFYLVTFIRGLIEDITVSVAAIALVFTLFTNSSIPLLSKILMVIMMLAMTWVNYYKAKKTSDITLDMYGELGNTNARFNFYANYYSDYNAGKDIRLYGLEKYLIANQIKFNSTIRDLNFTANKKKLKYEVLASVMNDVFNIATYVFVVIACIAGNVSIGNVLKYVSCIIMFTGSTSYIVMHAQYLLNNNKYLENYFKFLDIPSKMYQGTLSVEKRDDNDYEVEFRNVSFKYPSTDVFSLKNVSFKFRVGQKLAVVGMNGSGKTTMIKLLCRLYDPTEGEILLNGIDIRKYKYDEYLEIFSVVFQDFKLFSFSLAQNVATSVEYDSEKVKKYLDEAGLRDMPKGIDTPLYKDFDEDGVEISGGEAQKIALARALYKDAPFIVLDEPTAALDPVSEFEIYSKFNEIVGDKTAIYISHRLSSCRFCDDIIVFHEGELIQRGNHDDLILNSDGKYHELWNAQAQYYSEK
jgi:ABC-type multidrug transport system, ATPase and permease components